MKVVYGEAYGKLPVPTRAGYTFKGWNGKNVLDYNDLSSVARIYGIMETEEGYITDSTPESDGRPWSHTNSNWKVELKPGTYTLTLDFFKQSTRGIYSRLKVFTENASVEIPSYDISGIEIN